MFTERITESTKLLKIIASVAITTVMVERTVSTFRCMKIYLWSIMGKKSLNQLAINFLFS